MDAHSASHYVSLFKYIYSGKVYGSSFGFNLFWISVERFEVGCNWYCGCWEKRSLERDDREKWNLERDGRRPGCAEALGVQGRLG